VFKPNGRVFYDPGRRFRLIYRHGIIESYKKISLPSKVLFAKGFRAF
jgi:hypothetical protein